MDWALIGAQKRHACCWALTPSGDAKCPLTDGITRQVLAVALGDHMGELEEEVLHREEEWEHAVLDT